MRRDAARVPRRGFDMPVGNLLPYGNCPSSDDVPPVVLPRTATAHPGGASRQFRRTLGDYNTREPTGTIIIDTSNTYLYLVLGQGKALRYGIGLGREGFTWSGAERISRVAEWPTTQSHRSRNFLETRR